MRARLHSHVYLRVPLGLTLATVFSLIALAQITMAILREVEEGIAGTIGVTNN